MDDNTIIEAQARNQYGIMFDSLPRDSYTLALFKKMAELKSFMEVYEQGFVVYEALSKPTSPFNGLSSEQIRIALAFVRDGVSFDEFDPVEELQQILKKAIAECERTGKRLTKLGHKKNRGRPPANASYKINPDCFQEPLALVDIVESVIDEAVNRKVYLEALGFDESAGAKKKRERDIFIIGMIKTLLEMEDESITMNEIYTDVAFILLYEEIKGPWGSQFEPNKDEFTYEEEDLLENKYEVVRKVYENYLRKN